MEIIIEVEMEFEKATKNTYRYKEVSPEGVRPKLGTIYLLKSLFKNRETPNIIHISVKEN